MGIIFDKALILNRIKFAQNFKSNADLAKFLEIAPNTLTNWYTRNTIDYDLIFSKCKHLNADWLLNGEGEMLKEQNIALQDLQHCRHNPIPYYPELPFAHEKIPLNIDRQKNQPSGYILLPGVQAEFLCTVSGFSIQPIIKPGDIIGLNHLKSWEHVDPDKIYLIITKEGEYMLKRLRPDLENREMIWCISESQKEFPISKKEIQSILHVVFHASGV